MILTRGRDACAVLVLREYCVKAFVSHREFSLMQVAHAAHIAPEPLCCVCGVCVMRRAPGVLMRECSNPLEHKEEVLRLARVLCDIGIFHQDLHADNILVDGTRVYIIDYGDATPIDDGYDVALKDSVDQVERMFETGAK